MIKKILIIGANGMLGQDLIKLFGSDKSYEVVAWDRDNIDISNEKDVFNKIRDLKPNFVINSAAYNLVDKCEEEEGFKIACLVNGEGPGYLVAICKEIGAIFVHYSTDYVFKGDNKDGYKEDDKPEPISKYGLSKLLGEERVKAKGEKYYIARTCKLFGVAGGGKKSFVEVMLNLAHKQIIGDSAFKEIKIVDEELAKPTYTVDLAKQTKVLVEGKYPFGIYHITNENACTWYEFALEIFKLKNLKVKTIPVLGDEFKRPAARPKFSPLLNTRLPKMRSWQEALKDFLGNI